MDNEPACALCGKPLSTKAGWHPTFKCKDGFIWAIHETPCFGLVKDFTALEQKARARYGKVANKPVQLSMSFEE